MNVSALARQLKVTTSELLEKLPSLGFDIGARAIKVDDNLVPKITAAWKKQGKKERLQHDLSKITEIRGKEEGADDEKKEKKEILLGDVIIVKDMAELMGLPIARLMGELMKNGITVSLNERLDYDTASIIAEDLGFKIKKSNIHEKEETSKREKLEGLLSKRKAKDDKPPVVVVMGHVDHGKTKLLDVIRETNVVDQEAGGITQHIGAYQVTAHDRLITFLDTPGHEAFKAMRSRGGQIADVAILVVAADDGLQPQTLESISVIQKEKLPFVIAINKIDKENADVERVKQQLSEINLIPEDWGGKVICQPISAKFNKNITEVLDMVLLVADMENLKADDSGSAVGTIIESHVDKSAGPVATILVQAGTLKLGDMFMVGDVAGKIKSLEDWLGNKITKATPATPAKILGLANLPVVGEILEVILDKKEFKAKLKASNKKTKTGNGHSVTSDGNNEETKDIATLNLIIKSDVLGSAEAIEESLGKIDIPETKIKVLKKGLGQITEDDILNAEATNAIIISFHVKENKSISTLADEKKVTILYFDIIYKLLEEVEKILNSIKGKKTIHKLLGKLEVLAIFKTMKKSMIFGGKVVEGKITKSSKIKVIKNDEVVAVGQMTNLQSAKEDVSEVALGQEAGIEYQGDPVIEVGDVLEFFEEIYE
ncbi:translation initiation factor IF-2 [Candidatus Parcubacteria bacterium]|jgi:translation initiation factor IF-2|nr:translation initiation factor IF-2 [Candidatus Parcubacteria bacterium]